MPNWVYTHLTITGKSEDLLAFAKKAKAPHQSQWLSPDWVKNPDGTNTKVEEKDRKPQLEMETPDAISFWNFLAPTEEEIPYYFGHKTKPEDERDETLSVEEQVAKSMKFEGSGWYDWNIRNWGCKWDAGSDTLHTDLEDGEIANLTYTFETAWSPAEGAFRAMTEQHPELTFAFENEEEQGWGVNYEGEDGELSIVREWDIPQSHADYHDLDKDCICEQGDYDESDWFEDCPKPEQDFFVVVTKTYRVRTYTAENAWELAQDNDPDEQMELVEDEIPTIVVKDGEGNRVYPTMDDNATNVKSCSHHFVPCYGGEGSEVVFRGIESCVFCNEERPLETDPNLA